MKVIKGPHMTFKQYHSSRLFARYSAGLVKIKSPVSDRHCIPNILGILWDGFSALVRYCMYDFSVPSHHFVQYMYWENLVDVWFVNNLIYCGMDFQRWWGITCMTLQYSLTTLYKTCTGYT